LNISALQGMTVIHAIARSVRLKGFDHGYQLRSYDKHGSQDSAGPLLSYASGCATWLEAGFKADGSYAETGNIPRPSESAEQVYGRQIAA
jgi:hypothetical protein